MSDNLIKSSYNPNSEILELTAPVPKIYTHPAIKLTLIRLGAEVSGQFCRIKADKKNLFSIYRQIGDAIKKTGFAFGETESMSDELNQIYENERAFESFSQKALDIWSGDGIPEELSNFEAMVRKSVNRKLWDLQFLSALHLAFSQNACNFSVPGAGKTTIVYSAYSYLKNLPSTDIKHVDRLLVVGPLASFYAWKKEFYDCFGREPIYSRIVAGMSSREIDNLLLGLSPLSNKVELVHISFQTLVNLEDKLQRFLESPTRKTMMVVDEAHNIKREEGIWSSACLRLSAYASSRVVLTGTPAPNGYEDLYNLFLFLYPDRNLIGFPRANLVAMSEG